MPPRSVLPTIWFERNEALRLRMGPDRCFPPPARLIAEAEDLRRAIDRGEIVWPPEDGGSRPAGHRRVAFSILSLLGFSRLPSVAVFLDRVGELTSGMSARAARSVKANTLIAMYNTTLWKHYGRRVYVLDPVTCELLARTPLPGIPFGDVPLPVPAFYVVLPRGWMTFRPATDDGEQIVEGVTVVVDDVVDSAGLERLMTLQINGDSGRDDPLADGSTPMTVGAWRTTPLDQVLREALVTGPREGDRERGERLQRVILGLLLYLHAEHPLVEVVRPRIRDIGAIRNPAKRRKAEEANARASRLTCFYVGGERPEYAAVLDQPGPGRGLDHQVWVSGHWKQQPYGPRASLRRPLWIRPYLKGPDMAESAKLRVGIVRRAGPRT